MDGVGHVANLDHFRHASSMVACAKHVNNSSALSERSAATLRNIAAICTDISGIWCASSRQIRRYSASPGEALRRETKPVGQVAERGSCEDRGTAQLPGRAQPRAAPQPSTVPSGPLADRLLKCSNDQAGCGCVPRYPSLNAHLHPCGALLPQKSSCTPRRQYRGSRTACGRNQLTP
jgi:hypothetical protein